MLGAKYRPLRVLRVPEHRGKTGGRGRGQRRERREGPRQGENKYTQKRQPGRLTNHEDDGESFF
eukprot:7258158-Pyramimonas_sp.AAC.1